MSKGWEDLMAERFSLNEKEKANMLEFLKSLPPAPHSAIGGSITFHWTPTSIGAVTEIEHCSGAKRDITDYDSW